MKFFPPWKQSPLTSSGKTVLSLVERRAGSSRRCCLPAAPHERCWGGCSKEKCFTSTVLVILVFPAWFAWLCLNQVAKWCRKTQAPKHHCWCSDTVNGALVGFGPGVSMGQTSTGVWMQPPCLGESLNSWTRAGPCQTPSLTLPGSKGPTPLSVFPSRVGTSSRAEAPSPPHCSQSDADCCPACLLGPDLCSSTFHDLSSPARKRRQCGKWLPSRPACGNASWPLGDTGGISCLISNHHWP